MEKILLAIDGINLNRNALDFACYLGRLTKSKITGVFLENLVADEKPVLKEMPGLRYVDWEVDEKSDEYTSKMALIERSISILRKDALTGKCVSECIATGGTGTGAY